MHVIDEVAALLKAARIEVAEETAAKLAAMTPAERRAVLGEDPWAAPSEVLHAQVEKIVGEAEKTHGN